jgi:hypothetical protein
VVVLIVVSGCYIYGSLHQTTYRQYFPIHTALIASLLYIRDYGEPPRSVRDLIRTNCVEQESDDEHGFISPYMIWPTCKKNYFIRVHLSFPSHADELEVKNGRLIDKQTKADRYLAIIVPHDLIEVDQMKINVDIWKDWVKIERGEKVDWLEDIAVERQKYLSTHTQPSG